MSRRKTKNNRLQHAQQAVANLRDAIAELEADGAAAIEIKPYRDNLAAAELELARCCTSSGSKTTAS